LSDMNVHVNPMVDCASLDRYNAGDGTVVEFGRVLTIWDVGVIAEPFTI
jgi:hypothetical protein